MVRPSEPKIGVPRNPIIDATSPSNHDAREQFSSAPTLDNQAGRDVEEEKSEEENSGSQADDCIVETQVRLHPELGDADVRAIEIGEKVSEHQERNEAARDALSCADRNFAGMMAMMFKRFMSFLSCIVQLARQLIDCHISCYSRAMQLRRACVPRCIQPDANCVGRHNAQRQHPVIYIGAGRHTIADFPTPIQLSPPGSGSKTGRDTLLAGVGE